MENTYIKLNNNDNQQEDLDLHPTIVVKENIFTKIIKFIKNLFKR